MPESTLKIHNARYIITVDPTRRIIADGSILVRGQRIERVGKAADLEAESTDRVVDAREMVITPGFCNGHMHVSYAHATRGIFPDSLGRRYLPFVFKLQGIMTPGEEHDTSLLGITELLKYGTTTFVDPGSTKHIDTCLDAYARAGCRIITGTHVTDRPNQVGVPEYSTDEAIRRMEDTITRFDGALDGRVRAWAMPFSPATSSTVLMQAAKALADQHNTGLTLHHTNAPEYIEATLKEHGKRPTEMLQDLGVLGPNVLLSHALWLDESEVKAIARTGTKVVVVPTAIVKGGAGLSSASLLPEMLAHGITVGIGTDAGNNSNLVETMRAMYLVAVLYKDARRDVQMIPAETALELATISGAAALGLDTEIGSIEAGKRADLVLFDTKRPEWRTLFNPVNNLVYSADGRSVHTVIVDGRIVVENHRPTFVDEWELIQKVQQIGSAMMARVGVSFPSPWPIE
ncbi:MAG: amidohydrolase family protein [Chloroflexi bacterium]|nr:amidohydrolase family protein [Chloroflexota bacterium]